MYYVLFVIHLLIALFLCVVVLMQRSKGNGLAGAFGGVGAGEAMFGSHGVTTFLHKATIYLAVGFMVTSLSLAFMTARRSAHRAADGMPVRAGETVLPVGGDEVAAPELPTSTGTLPIEGEEAVGDDIVPAATEDEAAAAEGASESGTGSGTESGGEATEGGNDR